MQKHRNHNVKRIKTITLNPKPNAFSNFGGKMTDFYDILT